MKLNKAKEILESGKGLLCVVSPSHNSEHHNETCTINRINNGWVEINVNCNRINVRAKDIETLDVARSFNWR